MRLSELKSYFETANLPESFVLSESETIHDVKLFISTHIEALEANKGNKRFLPYYQRLLRFYQKQKPTIEL